MKNFLVFITMSIFALSCSTHIKPLRFTSSGTTTISLTKQWRPYNIILEYRVNNGDWKNYIIGTPIGLANHQTVDFRAGVNGNGSFSRYGNFYQFKITGSGTVAASGNIMALIYPPDTEEYSTLSSDEYLFYNLFGHCQNLTKAPELPATTLAPHCYEYMFLDCTSLTSAPELPATTLADGCYRFMFSGCTSLTSAPELPATNLAQRCYQERFAVRRYGCYEYMFEDCTSLTSAPELPATTLSEYCYTGMFSGCTSLTSAPELPATTLADGCYRYMFSGCTSLTSAPELPATSSAEIYYYYATMFYGCTSLTQGPNYYDPRHRSGGVSNSYQEPNRADEDQSEEVDLKEAPNTMQSNSQDSSYNDCVDLGLPSGTLWGKNNESGLFTYDEAVERFGSNLPTKKQYDELRSLCTWTWTGNGYKVTGNNGKYIFLSADGWRNAKGVVALTGTDGGYWSNSSDGSNNAWYLNFNSSKIQTTSYLRNSGLSVRCVYSGQRGERYISGQKKKAPNIIGGTYAEDVEDMARRGLGLK